MGIPGVSVGFLYRNVTGSIEENIISSILADKVGINIEKKHYVYEARPESNHHPVTLPSGGNTLCQYLNNRAVNQISSNDLSSYKTNEYLGYVIKCNRVIALNRVTDKKHIKYTIQRDRLALSKTDGSVEVVNINNDWFGYDLSKHTTTTTNLVYDKIIENTYTDDSII